MSVTDTSRKHKDGTEPTVAHRDPASTLTKQHRMVAKGMGYRLATSPGSAIYSVVCAKSSIMSNSLIPYGLQPARPLCPWDSPGKNTGVGCHALLQGIFPTQGWNLHVLHLTPWETGSPGQVQLRRKKRDSSPLLCMPLPFHKQNQ